MLYLSVLVWTGEAQFCTILVMVSISFWCCVNMLGVTVKVHYAA